jgi:diaminohydroxyphosphoribosylaminopyrimidine deaminase/5-amino-6-(5-phosphoribosylamino)uracil reductase
VAVARARAGSAARAPTAYVRGVPGAHVGRPGPRSAALVAAGVARVVVPIGDPDPRVDGRGLAALRAAGIAVETGCLAEDAMALNRGFLSRIASGRPALTLKFAASLDGRIATATGESRWITGPEARAEVHLMRARSDAVLVGAGTARADDPRLDVRDLGIAGANPVRVVVSAGLDLPLDGRLAATAAAVPLWLCHGPRLDPARRRAWEAAGAVLLEVAAGANGRLDLPAVLLGLGARGITRLLCEGGGRLAAGLLGAGLVDEVVSYSAGSVLGADAVPAVGPLGIGALALAPRFRLRDAAPVGPDLRTRWERQ